MQILEVKSLFKSFGGLVAIRDVNFVVNEGEILGLIGPNGSGKTTLFNLITRFLKPDRGEIRFQRSNLEGIRPYQICQMGIARTFQSVKPFANMTTLENVVTGRLYGSEPILRKSEARLEAERILEFIGFGSKHEVRADSLGLVDRKRLELGRALATKPKLLLLDEMMAGLNPVEIEGTMRLIERVRHSGITIIVVEHVMKAVLGISDKVMVLNVGDKIAEGTPEEVVSNKRVIKAYLGEDFYA